MVQTINARFIIQIAGKPKENVDKALHGVLNKLKSNSDKFKILETELVESDLDEKTTLYAGFIEVLAKFADVKNILEFIADYTPTSIEIEDPSTLKFDSSIFTGVLNDVSNLILRYQSEVRNLKAHLYVLDKKLKESNSK